MTRGSGPQEGWCTESLEDLREQAKTWLATPELRSLVEFFDGGPTPAGRLARHEELLRWSRRHLRTRAGRERQDVVPAAIDPEARQPLLDAADALGLLRTPEPASEEYDAIVVLGGAVTGNVLRAGLAEEVARRRTWRQVIGLTSDRPLGETELASDPHAVDDQVEWRHLVRQLHDRFGPLKPVVTEESAKQLDDLQFKTSENRLLRLLVAPPNTHGRRATTAQQLEYYCRRAPREQRGSVLLVTNAIYAPYQFFAGAPVLLTQGTNSVELVGTVTVVIPDEHLLYQRLSQEIHAGIEAATSAVTRT